MSKLIPHVSARDAAAYAFAEVDRLKTINAELLEALEECLPYVVGVCRNLAGTNAVVAPGKTKKKAILAIHKAKDTP